jgi:homoserine dehydrogenase
LRIALLLAGFGNVARRFVRLLDESREYLASEGIDTVVVSFATRRHGRLFDLAGMADDRLAQIALEGSAEESTPLQFLTDALERTRAAAFDVRVLVETTTLDIESGEPAMSHVRAAFAHGAHVISANKGPVALAHRALAGEAEAAGVFFLFEGAVMDGIPIFNLVRETMPGVTVRGFRGVVNSTTNYLLTAMERGEAFDAALQRMQAAGVAEADPSLDVEGWDAAAKTAALANVWLDADMTPRKIEREGITADTGVRAREVLSRGHRLKLVASAEGRGAGVVGRVRLMELAPDDPLAMLDEQGNALEIDTWPLGRIVITQRDGGLEKTAYALLSDLVTVARRISGNGPKV